MNSNFKLRLLLLLFLFSILNRCQLRNPLLFYRFESFAQTWLKGIPIKTLFDLILKDQKVNKKSTTNQAILSLFNPILEQQLKKLNDWTRQK